MVVLRPDEELSELESFSMTTKTMFCEREKVPVLNVNQQNDKSAQEYYFLSRQFSSLFIKQISVREILVQLFNIEFMHIFTCVMLMTDQSINLY